MTGVDAALLPHPQWSYAFSTLSVTAGTIQACANWPIGFLDAPKITMSEKQTQAERAPVFPSHPPATYVALRLFQPQPCKKKPSSLHC